MRRKVLEQSIKWLLPLLFIFFINGQSLFTHIHFIDDTIIVHSHPFKKGEKSTHNHTDKELVVIQLHTNSYSTEAVIPHIEINCPLFAVVALEFIRRDKAFFSKENKNILLRAPPHIL